MGRFNMGSTVILLTGKNVEWLPHIAPGKTVKMGQLIGHFPAETGATANP
jgi:phosphatidylserine decarboxylase